MRTQGRRRWCIAIVGFVLRVRDARCSTRAVDRLAGAGRSKARPSPGAQLPFQRHRLLQGHTTASGVAARTGIAAADPTLLPVGSVVNIATGDARYNGVYTIMDTGPEGAGPGARSLHVELPRGAEVRPQASRRSPCCGSDGIRRPARQASSIGCSGVAMPRGAFRRASYRRRPHGLAPEGGQLVGSDSGGRHLRPPPEAPADSSRDLVLSLSQQ